MNIELKEIWKTPVNTVPLPRAEQRTCVIDNGESKNWQPLQPNRAERRISQHDISSLSAVPEHAHAARNG